LKNKKEVLAYLITLVIAVILLAYFSIFLSGLERSLVFIVTALVAWPIWHSLCESRLYAKRLWVDGLFTKESWIREFLWKGTLVKIYLAVLSFVFSLLLLSLASLLKPEYFYILIGDVVLLVFVQQWIKSKLSSHANDKSMGLITRKMLYYGNIVVLSIIFASIDYITYIEFSNNGIDEIFKEKVAQYNYDKVGWIAAFFSTIELKLNSFFFTHVVGEIKDTGHRFLLWFVFLIKSGMIIWFFNYFILGLQLLIEKAVIQPNRKENIGSKSFSITLIVLTILYLVAVFATQPNKENIDTNQQEIATSQKEINTPNDKCQSESVVKESKNLNDSIKKERNETRYKITKYLDETASQAKLKLPENIDKYLDWHYSIRGEYTRLGMAVMVEAGQSVQQAAEQKISSIISQSISEVFDESIDNATNNFIKPFEEKLRNKYNNASPDVKDCPPETPPGLTKAQAGLTIAKGVGVVGARYAVKQSAVVVIRNTATKSISKILLKTATKATVKTGASIASGAGTGALAGAICGPFAPACALVGGTVGAVTVWFGIDKIYIEGDEYFHREEMKQDLELEWGSYIDKTNEVLKQGLFHGVDVIIMKFSPINNEVITQ